MLERHRQEDPWGLLASRSNWLSELQVEFSPVSKSKVSEPDMVVHNFNRRGQVTEAGEPRSSRPELHSETLPQINKSRRVIEEEA